jgi:hypothetical protein
MASTVQGKDGGWGLLLRSPHISLVCRISPTATAKATTTTTATTAATATLLSAGKGVLQQETSLAIIGNGRTYCLQLSTL